MSEFEGARVRWKDLNIYDGFAVEGSQAVGMAIINMVFTTKGERLFDPTFGCNLYDYLFEPIDEITARKIRSEIFNCIAERDPRIKVSPLTEVIPFPDDNEYRVKIVIEVLGSETTSITFTLPAMT